MTEKFKRHFEECPESGGPKELRIDIAKYICLQEMGIYKSFEAYDEETEEVVGYALLNVVDHPHFAGTLFCTTDCFFIEPEHRKGLVGYRFIRFIEKEMKEKYNCEYFQLVLNANNLKDAFVKRLGYETSSVVYTRKL